MLANDALEEFVKPLDEPFQKVLRSFRHLLHIARCALRENDQTQRRKPAYDHGISNRESEDGDDFLGFRG